jgi:hypothetical protein
MEKVVMPLRPLHWALAALCGTTLGLTTACHVPPSRETRSFYMAKATTPDATTLGCYNGDKDGRMTLFFGAPTTVNGNYGATLWGAPSRDVNQIARTIRDFISGYAYCRSDPNFRLLVGVGTSNSAIDGKDDAWLWNHGAAWATMVRDLNTWAATYYPAFAQVYAAWDFEPSWSQWTKADQWMHGYDSVQGRRGLYANASADGCPQQWVVNGPCNNGWNQSAVWHLAWQHDPSLPFPQIYATSGANAHQWQLIDLWATTVMTDGMYFYGTMTQAGACAQNGGCAGTNLAPHDAHDIMANWLASDWRTNQDQIPEMTDLSWWS